MALRMDEKTRAAMRGLLPFLPGAYITTTLDCFDGIPEEQRPLFRLRDFTAKQFQAMRGAVSSGGEVPLDVMIQTLQDGAMGPWENLPDMEFNEISFSKEAIATLPPRWIEAFYWAAAKLCNPNKLEKLGLGSSPVPALDTWSKTAPGADEAQA